MKIAPGNYRFPDGRVGWCYQGDDGIIRVNYLSGAFTACNRETFTAWGAEKCSKSGDAR